MISRKRSYTSRSRSKSSGFGSPRRKNRSRSKERYAPYSSMWERSRERSHSKKFDCSPRRSVSPAEQKSRSSRLKKPEIQSSINPITDFQTGGNVLLDLLIQGQLYTINAATLMRQAKEISIVIERTFPVDVNLSHLEKSETFDVRISEVKIPRRPNEGHKAVFDLPGIKFYNTVADEALIYKRLADTISSASSRKSNHSETKRESEYHDISHFTGPGRFYGSRVDERLMDSKRTYPLDPSETPRGQSYYLHDDRADDGYGTRRRLNNSRSDRLYSSSYQRDRRSRRLSPSPSRSRPSRSDLTSKKWLHDKFEEIEKDNSSQKPVPMPVPAPKPILWSTIGKEINGKKTVLSDDQNYSPNSAANQSPMTDSNDNRIGSPKTKAQTDTSNIQVNSSNTKVSNKDDQYNSEVIHLDVDQVFDESMEQ
ncbi:unnamed protein product [Trichobilharzia szidati]|nr:unnamed protein product [Trichobilharzia szidati]